ncbi:MAG: hemolysin family protein [Bacilli bacterium]|nr:hemolysin family protein [Bacilli bacterium]
MTWHYYLIIVILLIFSGFFSAADMVYGMVDRNRLETASEKGDKRAKVALGLTKDFELSISSILFGNNLVNILASSIVTIIGISVNQETGPAIAAIIFTIIVIIVGEFLPKAIAKRFNYSLALYFAYPIKFFTYLFFIVTWPISRLFRLISNLFKKNVDEGESISEDVLDEMIDEIQETGELDKDEAEIVRGAIDLLDIQAYEIMTPRVDVFALDYDDPIEEIIKKEELLNYSRIPIYKDTIDNIVGILPTKSLSKKLLNKEGFSLDELMYKPLVIPRSYQVINLLNDFKKEKVHIAIVIDEYGGTEGIVTMEDILEEVVGDIFDETDEISEEVIKKSKGFYIVDGGMNIDDFFELIDYKKEYEGDYSTVGGFVQGLKGDFAHVGDRFKFSHYRIKVLEADEFTVTKIQIRDISKSKRV